MGTKDSRAYDEIGQAAAVMKEQAARVLQNWQGGAAEAHRMEAKDIESDLETALAGIRKKLGAAEEERDAALADFAAAWNDGAGEHFSEKIKKQGERMEDIGKELDAILRELGEEKK